MWLLLIGKQGLVKGRNSFEKFFVKSTVLRGYVVLFKKLIGHLILKKELFLNKFSLAPFSFYSAAILKRNLSIAMEVS